MIPIASSPMTRKPFGGSVTTLVIAIDVGTTYSGVSYAILRPGEVPIVQGVTRFPDQRRVGASKVPSVLYYDKEGVMRAAGASTDDTNVIGDAEEEGWTKVEHFKLHMRPASMVLNTNGLVLGSLPKKKAAYEVFGDFLRYLFENTIQFIRETHIDGDRLWTSVKGHVQFVLSHPNGWAGRQQQLMRQSAVHAQLIPDTSEGHSRISFVSEGEASLHACLSSERGPRDLKIGDSFVIADAGGGTLDINTYEVTGISPLQIHETTTPDCRFAGAVFVKRHAHGMIYEKLKGTDYAGDGPMSNIMQDFDRTTKELFSNDKKTQWVTVGGYGVRDPALGIRNGKLKLEGKEVAGCFEFSINEATDAIKKQADTSGMQNLDVWLVGGFAASPWLYEKLTEELSPGFTIYRPDTNTSKMVAEGAVGYYIDRWVTTRVAKVTCGLMHSTQYDPSDPEHRNREHLTKIRPSGRKIVSGKYHCFVSKGTKVSEATTFSNNFFREVSSLSPENFQSVILAYTGEGPVPEWMDTRPDEEFKKLCVIDASLTPLVKSLGNTSYLRVDFEIEVKFGLVEFEARIKWVEDGNVKYGPAVLIYEN